MEPSEHIGDLVASHPDWRGQILADARRVILEVDPYIVEEWKYMGSPLWGAQRQSATLLRGEGRSKARRARAQATGPRCHRTQPLTIGLKSGVCRDRSAIQLSSLGALTTQ